MLPLYLWWSYFATPCNFCERFLVLRPLATHMHFIWHQYWLETFSLDHHEREWISLSYYCCSFWWIVPQISCQDDMEVLFAKDQNLSPTYAVALQGLLEICTFWAMVGDLEMFDSFHLIVQVNCYAIKFFHPSCSKRWVMRDGVVIFRVGYQCWGFKDGDRKSVV